MPVVINNSTNTRADGYLLPNPTQQPLLTDDNGKLHIREHDVSANNSGYGLYQTDDRKVENLPKADINPFPVYMVANNGSTTIEIPLYSNSWHNTDSYPNTITHAMVGQNTPLLPYNVNGTGSDVKSVTVPNDPGQYFDGNECRNWDFIECREGFVWDGRHCVPADGSDGVNVCETGIYDINVVLNAQHDELRTPAQQHYFNVAKKTFQVVVQDIEKYKYDLRYKQRYLLEDGSQPALFTVETDNYGAIPPSFKPIFVWIQHRTYDRTRCDIRARIVGKPPLKCCILWGDGGTAEYIHSVNGTPVLHGIHDYQKAGVYTAIVSVESDTVDGLILTSHMLTVRIAGHAPKIKSAWLSQQSEGVYRLHYKIYGKGVNDCTLTIGEYLSFPFQIDNGTAANGSVVEGVLPNLLTEESGVRKVSLIVVGGEGSDIKQWDEHFTLESPHESLSNQVYDYDITSSTYGQYVDGYGYPIINVDINNTHACITGFHWDTIAHQCIPNGNYTCQEGQYWDGEKCSSLSDVCLPGFTWGMIDEWGTEGCVPVMGSEPPRVCINGYHWNGTECIPNHPDCPSGEHWGCAECISNEDSEECPPGCTWNGSECVPAHPPCEAGHYWDGEKCTPDTTSCSVGQYYNGNACVSPCLTGFRWDGEKCVPHVQDCCPQYPDLAYWNGEKCVGVCYTGEYESPEVNPDAHFRFTIDTRQTRTGINGVSSAFSIPTNNPYPYEWFIDWGDGSKIRLHKGEGANNSSGVTHAYSVPGQYTITVFHADPVPCGWFRAFGFGNGTTGANATANCNKVVSLDSPLTLNMFATNREVDAQRVGDDVCRYMWMGCQGFNFHMGVNFKFGIGFDTLVETGDNFCESMFQYCGGDNFTMSPLFTIPQNIYYHGINFCRNMFAECTGVAFCMNSIITLPQAITVAKDNFAEGMFINCTGPLFRIRDSFALPMQLVKAGHSFAKNAFRGCSGNSFNMSPTFNLPQNITEGVGDHCFDGVFAECSGTLFTMNDVFQLPQGITADTGTHYCYELFKGCSGPSFTINDTLTFTQFVDLPPFCYDRCFYGVENPQARTIASIVLGLSEPDYFKDTFCPSDDIYTDSAYVPKHWTCLYNERFLFTVNTVQSSSGLDGIERDFYVPITNAFPLEWVIEWGDGAVNYVWGDGTTYVMSDVDDESQAQPNTPIPYYAGIRHEYAVTGTYQIAINYNTNLDSWFRAFGFGDISLRAGRISSAQSQLDAAESVLSALPEWNESLSDSVKDQIAQAEAVAAHWTMVREYAEWAYSASNRQKVKSLDSPLRYRMFVDRDKYDSGEIGNDILAYAFQGCNGYEFNVSEEFYFIPKWNTALIAGNNFARSMFEGCGGNSFRLGENFNLPQSLTTVGDNFARDMCSWCSGTSFRVSSQFNLPQGITTGIAIDHFASGMFRVAGSAFVMPSAFNMPQGIAKSNNFALEMFMDCHGPNFTMNNIFTLPQGMEDVGENFSRGMFKNCDGAIFSMNGVFNLPQSVVNGGEFFADSTFKGCSGAAFHVHGQFRFFNFANSLPQGAYNQTFYGVESPQASSVTTGAIINGNPLPTVLTQCFCPTDAWADGESINLMWGCRPKDIANGDYWMFSISTKQTPTGYNGTDTTFTIPVRNPFPYNWAIDWGDGTNAETVNGTGGANNSGIAHDYQSTGEFTITIQSASGALDNWMRAFSFDGEPQTSKCKFVTPESQLYPSMFGTAAEVAGGTLGDNVCKNMFAGCNGYGFTCKIQGGWFHSKWNSITEVGNDCFAGMFADCNGHAHTMLPDHNLPTGISVAGDRFASRMYRGCYGESFTIGSEFRIPSVTSSGSSFAGAMFALCHGRSFSVPAGFTLPILPQQASATIEEMAYHHIFNMLTDTGYSMDGLLGNSTLPKQGRAIASIVGQNPDPSVVDTYGNEAFCPLNVWDDGETFNPLWTCNTPAQEEFVFEVTVKDGENFAIPLRTCSDNPQDAAGINSVAGGTVHWRVNWEGAGSETIYVQGSFGADGIPHQYTTSGVKQIRIRPLSRAHQWQWLNCFGVIGQSLLESISVTSAGGGKKRPESTDIRYSGYKSIGAFVGSHSMKNLLKITKLISPLTPAMFCTKQQYQAGMSAPFTGTYLFAHCANLTLDSGFRFHPDWDTITTAGKYFFCAAFGGIVNDQFTMPPQLNIPQNIKICGDGAFALMFAGDWGKSFTMNSIFKMPNNMVLASSKTKLVMCGMFGSTYRYDKNKNWQAYGNFKVNSVFKFTLPNSDADNRLYYVTFYEADRQPQTLTTAASIVNGRAANVPTGCFKYQSPRWGNIPHDNWTDHYVEVEIE